MKNMKKLNNTEINIISGGGEKGKYFCNNDSDHPIFTPPTDCAGTCCENPSDTFTFDNHKYYCTSFVKSGSALSYRLERARKILNYFEEKPAPFGVDR